LKAAQDVVEGVSFSRVDLYFEQRAKRVSLENFSARTLRGSDTVELWTDLRIAPEVTFGETLPPLSIQAKATAERADMNIDARLSEGSLKLLAEFHPLDDGGVSIDARAAVRSVPLSTMVPLLTKSGIAGERFKPRFLWLDCEAAIKGRFQGLFGTSPLKLSRCNVEGGGSRIAIDSAVRLPGGGWEPFSVQFQNLDLRRVLSTFSVQGPSGIADEFGRLSGALEVRSRDDAKFTGAIDGIDLRFSKRHVRVVQRVNRLEVTGELRGGRMNSVVDQIELDGGEFDGEFGLEVDRGFDRGSVRAKVRKLIFQPSVSRLLVGGEFGPISGSASGAIAGRAMESFSGEWAVAAVQGSDLRVKNLRVKTAYSASEMALSLPAPAIELSRDSRFWQSTLPLFFDHAFDGEWIRVQEASISAAISPESGLRWERAQGGLEGGRIQFQSAGQLSREREMRGWVNVGYPLVKRLKWTIGGRFPEARFTADSKALTGLLRRARVDDTVLGLPPSPKKIGEMEESATPGALATGALKTLGERVVRKARRIVPGAQSKPADVVPAAAESR